MRLIKLNLNNFRNHEKREVEFVGQGQGDDLTNITIISGPNGAGKTNILEAISVLSVGKSHRAVAEINMITADASAHKIKDFAKIIGILDTNDKLEVVLTKNPDSQRIKKTYKFNNSVKKSSEFVGRLKTVLFAPEDIRLVAGSPSRRREYLDRLLAQTNPEYKTQLSKYNRVLKHRNKILEQAKGQYVANMYKKQLVIWNDQLLNSGEFIQRERGRFFKYAEGSLREISRKLYRDSIWLGLNYKKSELSREKLEKTERKELMYGNTQIGPHRDDYEFVLQNGGSLDLKSYGSRGQQRTGVLCIKILELEYLEEITKEKPILLLDDIFSELDSEYRKAVESICQNRQVIITTADEKSVPQRMLTVSANHNI